MAQAPVRDKPRILESLDVAPFAIGDAKYDNRIVRDPIKQERLKKSIAARGLLVRLLCVKEGDHYRVVDGQSRLDAAKALNLETVPIDVIAADDADAMLNGIVANNVREGNSAYELMQAALKLTQEKGMSKKAIADTLGISESHVSDLIAVSGLPERLHELVHNGSLGVPAAKELLRLQTPEEQTRWGFDFAQNQMSGPRATSMINTYLDIRKRQREMPPEQAMERAQAEPLFTCELCGLNRPIKGQVGKIMCADCWRDLTYLWETERRRHMHPEPPPANEKAPIADVTYKTTIGEEPPANMKPTEDKHTRAGAPRHNHRNQYTQPTQHTHSHTISYIVKV